LCPACNAAVSLAARFCKSCGASLSAHQDRERSVLSLQPVEQLRASEPIIAASAGEERKTVTALFVDLQGSTELIRDLDPESARAMLDPALKIMGEAVRDYGGYVVQPTGDGIFALFGAPLADEHHAQRALYASLRMQELLERYSQRLAAEDKPRLEARIGVNSGEVVMRSVESGGRSEYAPVGYATNLAERMQTVARAGGIAISDETRRLVEGYFEFHARGLVDIKGAAGPINVFDVTGLGPSRTRFEVSVRRGLTPFVGRADELGHLKSAFQLSLDGHGQILAIVAEAGAGKTRLLHEFKCELPARCKLLQAYSVPHRRSAYQPVVELLYGYFGIDQSDDKETRQAKIKNRLTTLDPSLNDTCPYIFALLGIQGTHDPAAQMDPLVKRKRTLDALKRIILRESLNQPTVLIFEDLHWIDSETQRLLNVLAEGIAEAPVLLLVNYRPEYEHDWAKTGHYAELRLDRLRPESAETMLRALLGEAAELEALRRHLHERTEGNPLFIEETVRALFDDGTLVRDSEASPSSARAASKASEIHPGNVKTTRPLSQLRLPSTVQGILAARIDRLQAEHKEALQLLAVVGREAPLALIREVAPSQSHGLGGVLEALQAGDFIYEQIDTNGTAYKFKHARTHEVAYNSLLIQRRKQIHRRVAAAIESIFAGHVEDYLNELAHHHSRADGFAEAVKYLGLAAKREIVKSAYESAIQQLTMGREFLSRVSPGFERDRLELDLLIDYGVTLLVLRGFHVPELGETYRHAVTLCKNLGENRQLMSVLFGLSTFHLCRAELKLARQQIEELSLLPLNHKSELTILTGWLMGNAQFFMGEFANAHRQFEEAIKPYDKSMHRDLTMQSGQDLCVSCLAYDAMALLIMGFPDQAERRLAASIALARELGHPFTLVVCLVTAANYFCLRRDYNRLPAVVSETHELATEHGFTFYEEGIKAFEIIGLAFEGKMDELRAKSRFSKRFSELRYELALTWAQSTLAEAFAQAGLITVSKSLLNEAIMKMNRNDERFVEAEIKRIHGVLTLKELPTGILAREEAEKALVEAEQEFREARSIALRNGAKLFALRASASLASLMAGTPRRGEGEYMLEECLSSFPEGVTCPDLVEGRAILQRCRTEASPQGLVN
jgi:class 3 adenylate cyclase/tetratricopeptide (TPR) repeat protein